jgi:hypothetical protein
MVIPVGVEAFDVVHHLLLEGRQGLIPDPHLMDFIWDELWHVAAVLQALELSSIVEDKEIVEWTLDTFVVFL